jgi:hypothetical protein
MATPPSHRLLLALLAALALAGGCVAVEVDGEPQELLAPGTEEPIGDPTVEPPAPGDDLEVDLEVVEGPEGSTLAYVPVFIDEEGPFLFALDTGASNSVVTESVADELGLEVVGEVTGVTGQAEAERVQVTSWRMGEVDLGARPILSLDLATGPAGGQELQGLLGSDVLSEFGAITVDYDEGVLRLRPSAR